MSLSKETASIRKQDVPHQWFVVDLEGVVLGRAAVKVANILRGKDKPSFTPNADTGDFVVCINAAKVTLTGNKMQTKMYRHHTQFVGGLKEAPARIFLLKRSDAAFRQAVWGMLPKGALGRRLITKLKVYPGPTHPHAAQGPLPLAM